MNPSLVAKEIEATKVIFYLLVNLHGVTWELLKIHNFANVIQVPLCPINLVITTSICKKNKGEKVVNKLQ
jgi:hypothetical protein